MVSKEQVQQGLALIIDLARGIREAGSEGVAESTIYLGCGCDPVISEKITGLILKTGTVELRSNHRLYWKGN